MSINYNPGIVTSNLQLCLDAGNKRSYSGSGSTWLDATSLCAPMTLSNNPTYNSSNPINFTFDGTDDYVDFTVNNLGSTATIEMWIKLGATYGANKMFFGWNLYDVYTNADTIGYNTGNGDIYGISAATASSLGVAGNWKQFVFLMRSDVSYTNNKIWVNAASQTLSQQLGTELASNRSFNSGQGRIAGWRAENSYRMNMDLAIFRIYNVGLTDAEVTQNFEATRNRFGI